ncbi:C45 family autoproteolytic acyltransferase/hydolase [uncultured Dubosiella sp.]|uniref:C45 family autoproteolytic acyltransferase/hydolase n=2 Tax=uncultured Dubosiella sp. TaxID=1937011 RepID=UPI00259BC971|nr:C45 family autoproteolytic acyltransferase/hydolase [uncultured Dubosiella sp.]
MNHINFYDDPFQAGCRWGRSLRRQGVCLARPYAALLTEERKAFARLCLPHYERYAPALLKEMKGIAQGNQIDFFDLFTFVSTMYCFTFQPRCTCIAWRKQNRAWLGRNSDFFSSLSPWYAHCAIRYPHSLAFQGNTTAFVEMEDGMNEAGLAVGLTMVYPTIVAPGLNAGVLVRCLLERCATIEEALRFLTTVPIASQQTIMMADQTGRIVLVEANRQRVQRIESTGFLVATNAFCHPDMQKFNAPFPVDDWQAGLRRQTATKAMEAGKPVEEILAGRHGFMNPRDVDKDTDTVWSVVYDCATRTTRRCEGSPARQPFFTDKSLPR